MSDELETRVQVRKWFVETGYVDGNGVGLWDQTEESVEVSSRAEAEALRDAWEASGKLERTRWGELRFKSPYGAFRIRSVWEDAPPDAAAITSLRAELAAAQQRVTLSRALVEGSLRKVEKAEAERDAALTVQGAAKVLLDDLDNHLFEGGYKQSGPMRSIVARLRALAGDTQ